MAEVVIGKQFDIIKTVIALLRVSTAMQAAVQFGSLDQQKNTILRWAHDFCERHKFQLRITFIEEDISGRGESLHKRKGLIEAERRMRQGTVDVIVFEKLDRLSRDQIRNKKFLQSAYDTDTEVYEVESGKIDLKDRGSRLGFNIKNMLAEEYSLELEEKITKKQREAAVNNGKDTSSCPVLGLDRHPTLSCMYERNFDELKIVEDIMKRFVRLQSYVATVEYCEKKDYRDKERTTNKKTDRLGNIIQPRKIGGEPFDEKHLHRLLTNPKLRGRNCFEDTWNQFPRLQDENKMVHWDYWHRRQYGGIIDPELVKQVDETIQKVAKTRIRKAKDGTVYLMTGILKAPDDSMFYGASAQGGKYKYYYNKNIARRYSREDIDGKVLKRIKEYLTESGTLEKIITSFSKNRLIGLPLLDEEIQKLKGEIKTLEKAVNGFSDKLRTATVEEGDGWKKILEVMVAEREKAEVELGDLRERLEGFEKKRHWVNTELREQSVQDCFKLVLKNFDQKCDIEKRRMIRAIIPEAIIHADHTLELRINPDPNGKATDLFLQPGSVRHGGHNLVGIRDKWRGGRDSNPRPSA